MSLDLTESSLFINPNCGAILNSSYSTCSVAEILSEELKPRVYDACAGYGMSALKGSGNLSNGVVSQRKSRE